MKPCLEKSREREREREREVWAGLEEHGSLIELEFKGRSDGSGQWDFEEDMQGSALKDGF